MTNNIKRIQKLSYDEMQKLLGNEKVTTRVFNNKGDNKLPAGEESTFIAHAMSFFKPLSLQDNGSIKGNYKGYEVIFILQFKVRKYKTSYWYYIDLAIKLLDPSNKKLICLTLLEYDGDDRHNVQFGVIKDKEKDINIFNEINEQPLRYDTQMVNTKRKIQDLGTTIRNRFQKELIKIDSKYQYVLEKNNEVRTLIYSSMSGRKYIVCPLCEGAEVLGTKTCKSCKGNGYIDNVPTKTLFAKLHLDDMYNCPVCQLSTTVPPNSRCNTCSGDGEINREQAIAFRKEILKSD